MASTPPTGTIVMLGRDHLVWGRGGLEELEPVAACFLSPGADRNSPSNSFKGDPRAFNEDALLLKQQGQRFLLAVADAHFGIESSHGLIQVLAESAVTIPESPAALTQSLAHALVTWKRDPTRVRAGSRSATTLLLAVYDRGSRQGFGLSVGDSTLTVVSLDRPADPINSINNGFLESRSDPAALLSRATPFSFDSAAGQLIVAFTDGVNECHYRSRETSITSRHMQMLFADTGSDPREYARALGRLALDGLPGHPGGQDNIALIVLAS